MQNTVGRLGTFFRYVVVVLLGFAIVLSFQFRIVALTHKKISFVIIVILLLAAFLILNIWLFIFQKLADKKLAMLFLILVIAAPRLLWVFLMPTKPVSDYLCFYSYAQKASQGFLKGYDMTFTLFRFRFGYSLILSLVFKIFGNSIIVGKLFNVFLSVILGLIIYFTVAYLFGKEAAAYSAVLYAFWPSQIMYNSVLASEHPFIVFFVLGLYFLIRAIKEKKAVYGLFAGVFVAISNHIRPVAVVVIIAAVFLVAFKAFCRDFKTLKIGITGLISYVVIFYTLGYLIFCLTGIPVWKTSMGLNLMIGTDYTTYGMNNPKHSLFVKKYAYDFQKVHGEAMKIGLERLRKETKKFLAILPRKHAIIWGDDSFGYFWSTFRVYKATPFVNLVKTHPTIFYMFSQLYYYVILIYIILGILSSKKDANKEIFLLLNLIFLGYVALHIFLEVQPRYHYPGIFTLFLLSGQGIKWLREKLKRF